MNFFTPYKKRANAFTYIPRFYDPIKEAREQRRRELRGESIETDNAEYSPGMYLRTQREARAERRRNGADKRKRGSSVVIAFAAVLVILFVYMVYPRITEMLSGARRAVPAVTVEEEEFNPYAPITIVPNDYVEE